jgi:DNA-binding transcriptional LysR family regulator
MEPTPRALQIAETVTRALAQIERLIDEQRDFDPRTSKRDFTLRISDYVAQFLLPSLCSLLRAEAPGVTLRVAHFNPDDAGGGMEPNEVHLRVAGPEGLPVGCTGLRLLEDEFVVLMSRKHEMANLPMTLERYLVLPHVKVAAPALGTNMIDDALSRRGLRRNIVVTVPSWFDMRGVIANTDLVVAMPRRWVTDPAFSEGCVWQPLPLEVIFAVDLRWRSRDAHDPGHRWLCDLIARALEPTTPKPDSKADRSRQSAVPSPRP